MKRCYLFVLLSILLLTPISRADSIPKIDPSTFYLWNGFETSTDGWGVNDWDNNAFSNPVISDDYASEGKKCLEFKASFAKEAQQGIIQLFDLGDFTAVKKIKVDIYNSTLSRLSVKLMVKTGTNWLMQTSPELILNPGWNKGVAFDLQSNFNDGTGPAFDKKLMYAADMRRLGLQFSPVSEKGKFAPVDGYVAIDNVMLNGEQGITAFLPVAEPDDIKEVVIDNFKNGTLKWMAAAGWSCATGAEQTTDETGKGVMKAKYKMDKPGLNAAFVTEGSFDLSDVYRIKMDIFNPNSFSMNAGFAFATGDKWVWQEGRTLVLKKGWNYDVTFNVKKKEWKSEASGWKSDIVPADISQVKRLSILLYPPDIGEGYALISNIRFDTTDPGKLDALVPVDLGNLSYRVWNSYEKGINWLPAVDQSGAVGVFPIKDFGGEKNNGMELKFSTQNNVDKASFAYTSRFNFSDSTGIKFDVYNPMDYGVKVSIAFKTGDDQVWIESKQVGIAPGWNKGIFFDFITPSFKSADSNWNFNDYFSNRNDIREMDIQVYPDAKVNGSLYFTDFKLARRNYMGSLGDSFGFTFQNNTTITAEAILFKSWDHGGGEGTFENPAAINSWSYNSSDMSGWGPSSVSISDKFASQGNHSLKVDFKDANVKFGVEYNDSSGNTFSVANKDYMEFDVYNPGKMMKVSVAFKNTAAINWYESNQQVIYPGWNKNIRFDLDSPVWKDSANQWFNSDTMKNKDSIQTVFILFYNGIEGSVYLDNFRWGYKDKAGFYRDGGGTLDTGINGTEANVEQDINVLYTPNDSIEAKMTVRAAYYNGQNNDLNIASGHLTLRGMGNEFTVFSGENTKPFNDVVGIIDPANMGSNIMGASLSGTLYPVNTSYLLTAMSLDSTNPWKLGTTYAEGARLKTYFLDKDFVGAIYLNTRRGYDSGANPFTGSLEESSNIFGADSSLYFPWTNALNLNLREEVLWTQYATTDPVYVLSVYPQFKYISQALTDLSKAGLIYSDAALHYGYLTLFVYYRQIGANFAANFINPDYGIGYRQYDAKATYIMDDVWPFAFIGSLSPAASTFVHDTQLMAEFMQNRALDGTYKEDSFTLDLQNDSALAINNYHIWWKYDNKGDPLQLPTNSISGQTKIQAGDKITFTLLGRYESLQSYLDNALSPYNYSQVTGFIQASVKFSKDFQLTVNYKAVNYNNYLHSNWYGEFDLNALWALNMAISYGVQPFTGYWLDDNSDDTISRFALTFKGYF
jgi:hypothetical protein